MFAHARVPLALLAALNALCPIPRGALAETPVDLELVLAVDVSGSMDMEEQAVQRAGYMAALVHPQVLAAIRGGGYGRIAAAYVEWGGPTARQVTVPWRLIESAEDAATFVSELAEAPTSRFRGTSISGALEFSAPLFDDNGFEGFRRVIDISGDGPNNTGVPVAPTRDAVLGRGITINGLPILLRPSSTGYGTITQLDVYYEDCVIGGPGAFVVAVDAPEQLPDAIRRKLVLEIAGPPARAMPAARHQRPPRVDCMIGESLRRFWGSQR
jgi:hypothetical protein